MKQMVITNDRTRACFNIQKNMFLSCFNGVRKCLQYFTLQESSVTNLLNSRVHFIWCLHLISRPASAPSWASWHLWRRLGGGSRSWSWRRRQTAVTKLEYRRHGRSGASFRVRYLGGDHYCNSVFTSHLQSYHRIGCCYTFLAPGTLTRFISNS